MGSCCSDTSAAGGETFGGGDYQRQDGWCVCGGRVCACVRLQVMALGSAHHCDACAVRCAAGTRSVASSPGRGTRLAATERKTPPTLAGRQQKQPNGARAPQGAPARHVRRARAAAALALREPAAVAAAAAAAALEAAARGRVRHGRTRRSSASRPTRTCPPKRSRSWTSGARRTTSSAKSAPYACRDTWTSRSGCLPRPSPRSSDTWRSCERRMRSCRGPARVWHVRNLFRCTSVGDLETAAPWPRPRTAASRYRSISVAYAYACCSLLSYPGTQHHARSVDTVVRVRASAYVAGASRLRLQH